MFRDATDTLLVVGLEPLILMKRTQRAKDYPVIAELSRLLPPDRELELTTDLDRIVELARAIGGQSSRPPVQAAREGRGEESVELALVQEIRAQRQADGSRIRRYERAAERYLAEFLALGLDRLPLGEAHEKACTLAERLLPREPGPEEQPHADAQ